MAIYSCRVHFDSQGKKEPEIVTAAREPMIERKESKIWRLLVFIFPELNFQIMWLFRMLRNKALVKGTQARGYLCGTSQVGIPKMGKFQYKAMLVA